MATEEVNRSTSPGATESQTRRGGPPSPSLPTAHLQPQPVGFRVYQTIAEVNSGFEKVIHHLHLIEQFNFFPADILTAWLNSIQHLQADANSHLLEVLSDRELNNASYYDRLCFQRERELADPNDVLIEAERRRQELAAKEEQSLETD